MKRYISATTYQCVVTLYNSIDDDYIDVIVDTTADTEAKAINNAKYKARGMYPGYRVTSVDAYITNDKSPQLQKDSDRQTFCPRCNVLLDEDGWCPECGEFIDTISM